ncbi:uncharacterized protein LOC106415032 isoform X1 [Brassica napus]|uniref:uncharacterized protein LOC106415032 isoform X1 n=1 Tax=Brassica napus TaxID=3708 RepID=UPI002079E4D9|nr:uncharacterized protein LOC106415032 isoform X1 [Brassica napus]
MCTTHHDDQPQQQNLPCLHCDPHSYIHMVQHMIERCIILRMSRDECVQALDHHATIPPLVTLTVWRGLERENKDFFETYEHSFSPEPFSSKIFWDHQCVCVYFNCEYISIQCLSQHIDQNLKSKCCL